MQETSHMMDKKLLKKNETMKVPCKNMKMSIYFPLATSPSNPSSFVPPSYRYSQNDTDRRATTHPGSDETKQEHGAQQKASTVRCEIKHTPLKTVCCEDRLFVQHGDDNNHARQIGQELQNQQPA